MQPTLQFLISTTIERLIISSQLATQQTSHQEITSYPQFSWQLKSTDARQYTSESTRNLESWLKDNFTSKVSRSIMGSRYPQSRSGGLSRRAVNKAIAAIMVAFVFHCCTVVSTQPKSLSASESFSAKPGNDQPLDKVRLVCRPIIQILDNIIQACVEDCVEMYLWLKLVLSVACNLRISIYMRVIQITAIDDHRMDRGDSRMVNKDKTSNALSTATRIEFELELELERPVVANISTMSSGRW